MKEKIKNLLSLPIGIKEYTKQTRKINKFLKHIEKVIELAQELFAVENLSYEKALSLKTKLEKTYNQSYALLEKDAIITSHQKKELELINSELNLLIADYNQYLHLTDDYLVAYA